MSQASGLAFRRVATFASAIASLTLALAAAAWASLPQGRAAAPKPIAPVDGGIVSESGLRFAWTPAPGAQRHLLLVSRQPFQPGDWKRLSDVPDGVRAIELGAPVTSPEQAGITFDADGPLYWAAASELKGGVLRASEVQSAHVLKKFANRVEQSPLLRTSPVRRMTASSVATPGTDRIRLRAGFDIDPTQGEPALPQGLRTSAAPTSGRKAVIAYYGSADPEEARRSIMASGGTVISYLPDHAFLVRTPASGRLSLAEGAWVGDWQPAYKLSPRLPSESAAAPFLATVLAFPDADWSAVKQAAQFAGASIEIESRNGINQILRVRATPAQLQALAQSPDIAWIEPYVQPEMHNNNAQWITQTGTNPNRRLWDMGIRGEGQVVMTTDSGMNMGHNQFRDPLVPVTDFGEYPTHRKVIAYQKGSPVFAVAFGDHGVFHGSHTGGTIAGSDDGLAADPRDGMAKAAKIWFMDLSGTLLGNGVAPPADLNDLFLPGYIGNAGGAARIASNSWGAPVNGDYDIESLQVDQFMWNHPDFLIFFSNGNSAASGTVGSPATAKSSVGAGGVQNGSALQLNNIYTSTSRGPTQDNRRKPTICSPGQTVSSSTSGTSSYQSLSGTSMACPSMAGAAALIRQYVTEGWYPTGSKVPANGFTPSAALLKAMCVNSGANMVNGFNTPDNNVGWGRINADSLCYFAGDARRLLLVDQTDGLAHGQTIQYQINVVDASQPLKVSLVWTDAPGNPAVTPQLVNNLNLTVTNGVTTYLGNVFSVGFSTTGGSADNVNVEEGVRINAPATGVWTVRVDGVNIPTGPQPYGLVITGGVGTDAGTLALDRASYGASSVIEARVTDNNAAGATVHISSTTEPAGEDIVLTGGSGVWNGTLQLSPITGAVGDGILQVSNGDAISATYVDVLPTATLNASAQVDMVAPIITAVGSSNQGNGRMLLTWTTNSGGTSRVYYGTTPDLGSSSTLDPTLVTGHAHSISGVSVGQTYYFDVESRDINGNTTRDDNGGDHYRFTVNPAADILLIYDSAAFERSNYYDNALNALGWTYDVWDGSLASAPVVGDLATGMRSYKTVWWQNGLENYPPFTDAAIAAVTSYLDGGGRLVVTGHDIAWANSDGTSPYFSATRSAWVNNTLRTQYDADRPGWTGVTGVVGDPISGPFSGGVPYAEHRPGAAGDEIAPLSIGGTATTLWNSVEGLPAPAGVRWESSGPLGTPGSGVWGGATSRLAGMWFEWTGIDVGNPASTIRNDIMQNTLVWLIGRQHPVVTVTAPNGGEVLTGATANITWTESTFGGTSVASRTVEYSLDNGQSWTTLTTSAGPSPYVWNLGGLPNGNTARVRVRVTDNGSPALASTDASNATFSLSHSGSDPLGPVVVAGSIQVSPNPVSNAAPANSSATLTDAGRGESSVTQAEWSFGDAPAGPGLGHPMTGAFGTTTVNVSAALATASFPPGTRRVWVRGRDAEGNWGPAGSLEIHVNGGPVASVPERVVDFGLQGNVPNPVASRTIIGYSLPVRSDVDLRIFDVSGRQVKRLVGQPIEAGVHQAQWDRRDDQGRLVLPGVYYYRLSVAGRSFERRLVTMN